MSFFPASPNWRRLFTAYVASTLGDQFTRVAIFPKVGVAGGSLVWLFGLALAQSIPMTVVAPVAGYMSDRGRRRDYLIAADLARAALLCIISFSRSLPFILVGASIIAVFSCAFRPIEAALEAELLPMDDITRANGLRVSVSQLLSILGPALAGVTLIWLPASRVLLIDAMSFLVSAFIIATLPAERSEMKAPKAGVAAAAVSGSVFEGFTYIAQRADLCILFAVVAAATALLGMQNPLFYGYVQQTLLGDGPTYGLLIAALGAGGLLASLALSRTRTRAPVLFLLLTLCFDGASLLAFTFTRVLIFSVILMSALGAIGAIFRVTIRSYLQTNTASNVRGRVIGSFLGMQAPIESLSLTLGIVLASRLPAWVILRGGAIAELIVASGAIAVSFALARGPAILPYHE